MSQPFVWFHNNSTNPSNSVSFYQKLLGWTPAEGPPGMTMFAGEKGPFAGVGAEENGLIGWVPYVQVESVDSATSEAKKLGATVVKNKTRGPAGEYTIVRDPGGAAVALWQKA